MLSKISKRYKQPTPLKYKRIGDAVLILGAAFSGSVMGLPIPDNTKLWIIFAVNMITACGKILTNMATEPGQETAVKAEETTEG